MLSVLPVIFDCPSQLLRVRAAEVVVGFANVPGAQPQLRARSAARKAEQKQLTYFNFSFRSLLFFFAVFQLHRGGHLCLLWDVLPVGILLLLYHTIAQKKRADSCGCFFN